MCKHPLPSLKRNVTLALEILIYASVNCGFSGFAGLEIPLVIHVPKELGLFNVLVGQPLLLLFSFGEPATFYTFFLLKEFAD